LEPEPSPGGRHLKIGTRAVAWRPAPQNWNPSRRLAAGTSLK